MRVHSPPPSLPSPPLLPPQLMNGHIWVESNGKSGGATYKFLVMLKLDSAAGGSEDEEEDTHDINFFALRVWTHPHARMLASLSSFILCLFSAVRQADA